MFDNIVQTEKSPLCQKVNTILSLIKTTYLIFINQNNTFILVKYSKSVVLINKKNVLSSWHNS